MHPHYTYILHLHRTDFEQHMYMYEQSLNKYFE